MDVSSPAGVATVKAIGRKYGWSWGEAPSEWWHVTYRGGWSGSNPGPGGIEPPLRQGDKGGDVKTLQKRLSRLGYHPIKPDGRFGSQTAQIVRRFQANQKMKPDGVVGRGTQRAIKQALRRCDRYRCTPTERRLINAWLARHERGAEAKLIEHRKRLHRLGDQQGWNKHDRRIRYTTIARVTTDHRKVHVN